MKVKIPMAMELENNEDQDDNNDGFSDEAPIISKVITPNQPGVESTWKIINIEDYPFTTVRVLCTGWKYRF